MNPSEENVVWPDGTMRYPRDLPPPLCPFRVEIALGSVEFPSAESKAFHAFEREYVPFQPIITPLSGLIITEINE